MKRVLVLAMGGLLAAVAMAAPQPNIVHVLADDLGWTDVAAYYRAVHGREAVYETPNIDRIAARGMRFMQAYSPSAVCAPSRAAYITGQWVPHNGVISVLGGRLPRPHHTSFPFSDPFYSGRAPMGTPCIPKVLKSAGYTTAHVQKWHCGGMANSYPGPVDYGFDFSWLASSMNYNDPGLWDPADKKTADFEGIWRPINPHRLADFPKSRDPEAPYALDENDRPYDSVTGVALRWMEKTTRIGKEPFFLNFCPSFVHGPISTRDRARLAYYCAKMGYDFPTDPGQVTDRMEVHINPYYAAMVDSFDWQVGQLLEFLEKTDDPRNPGHKLIENTYIMISSDNGGCQRLPIMHGKGHVEWVTDNSPLRGGKQSVCEGGIRIPFVISGPGIAQGSVNATPINLVDLFPTYMAMAGVKDYPGLELDGCNLLPIMTGRSKQLFKPDGELRDTLYWHYPIGLPQSSMIRKGEWKLRLNYASEANLEPKVELFKLYNDDGTPNDLGESHNLADSHPEKSKALLDELVKWCEKYDAPATYKVSTNTGKKLPGAERVPKALERSIEGSRVIMRFETGRDKSRVVSGLLLYTTNGSLLLRDSRGGEEWFSVKAKIEGGVASAQAPAGMTHGVFYLRDENGFMVTSEPIPAMSVKGAGIGDPGSSYIKDGYAFRPGMESLINLARQTHVSAVKRKLDTAALDKAIGSAEHLIQQPVEENSYAEMMRTLRREIHALKVPEATRPIINQFVTRKWR